MGCYLVLTEGSVVQCFFYLPIDLNVDRWYRSIFCGYLLSWVTIVFAPKQYIRWSNERPVYHAACKDGYRP